MRYGRKARGPVGRIAGVGPVEKPDVILRVRALEGISGPAKVDSRPSERTFAQVLDRHQRGVASLPPADPTLPLVRQGALPSASNEDDEPLFPPDPPLRDSFLDRLWLKLKTPEGSG